MTSLEVLDFSGLMNTFDSSYTARGIMVGNMTNLCNLRIVDLTYSLSYGNITKILEGLPWCSSNRLNKLHLGSNNISGKLPDRIGKFAGIVELDLSYNHLTGVVPSEIDFSVCQLGPLFPAWLQSQEDIDKLDISSTGSLPEKIGALSLEYLTLSFNNFKGHIPVSVCELNLNMLSLDNNNFEGELPQCLRVSELIILRNNKFSGMFPSFFQASNGLKVMDLSRNKFTGILPIWLEDLRELQFLRLSYNMFSGTIPPNIGNLRNLNVLDIAGNSFSGGLPLSLINLTGMTTNCTVKQAINLSQGYLLVVTKHQERYYKYGSLPTETSIDLSSNKLTGVIPEEIVSLDALKNLNLSCNYLSGKIPENLGIIKSLESIDLSRNKLSGEIPSSISNLTALSYLDLSYNNLTGVIPLGPQLNSLYSANPNIYGGNSGLCGPPLQKNCSSNHTSPQEEIR
uniref:Leucine-rich repeat-containing N-terminal plant-type domain-containing protein n=1 Tax=Leersia perrieri TaxID=77586 RepID=A0A0D9XT88_9ORYZ